MKDETNNLERSIGRLEGKIDGLSLVVAGVKADVVSLANDFSTMEKGRLSKLEVAFATLSTEVSVKAQSRATWMSAAVSLIVSIVSALVIYALIHQIVVTPS